MLYGAAVGSGGLVRTEALRGGTLQLRDLGGKLALLAIVALRLILCLICDFGFVGKGFMGFWV